MTWELALTFGLTVLVNLMTVAYFAGAIKAEVRNLIADVAEAKEAVAQAHRRMDGFIERRNK